MIEEHLRREFWIRGTLTSFFLMLILKLAFFGLGRAGIYALNLGFSSSYHNLVIIDTPKGLSWILQLKVSYI